MLRRWLPAATITVSLAAGFTMQPAQAARCPTGKIYRVSLKVCAPRSANVQFLKGGQRVASLAQGRGMRAVPLPPHLDRDAYAPTQSMESATGELTMNREYVATPAPPPAAPSSQPAPAAGGFSPYGALR